jgi:4-hydroxybutyrate dehydrogenase/sulfolactaldehyde 3-reductase
MHMHNGLIRAKENVTVKIGFIGLGTMGLPMARNILQGGHQVAGHDTSTKTRAAHVANGGTAASSAAEAADDANILITMLPTGDIVRSVLLDADGAAARLPANALVIDMSTIHPMESDAIRDDLASRGIGMVDAPVGRTSVDAEAGKSLFMAGGTHADIERAEPILECMGDVVINCGGPGLGIRMKIVNNLMTTSLNVLTAEVLTMAEGLGLDRNLAIEVMGGTPAGRGHMSTTYPARVLKGDLSPAFMIDLAKKDLDIALQLSSTVDIPLSLAQSAEKVYDAAQVEGRGQQDWTAIYAMLRDKHLKPST